MNLTLIGVVGSLLLLGGGAWRKNNAVTAAALFAFVSIALLSIPACVAARARHDDVTVSAIVGLAAAAAIALATLFTWRSTRRYPSFSVGALLAVGLGVVLLFARA